MSELSSFASEIHAAVWTRVGLSANASREKVQEFVRQWAADWTGQRDESCNKVQSDWKARINAVIDSIIESWDESLKRDKEKCRRDLLLSMEYAPERREKYLEEVGRIGVLPLSKISEFVVPPYPRDPVLPPDPPLPLPPDHRSRTLPEKWASLAAIHDYYWKGDKIDPWPRPADKYDGEDNEEGQKRWVEAWNKWFDEGWAFCILVEQAGKLPDDDKPYVEQWLKDVAAPSELSGGKGADGRGQGDKKGDKKKNPPRPLNTEVTDCIRIYNRKAKADNKRPSMKAICKQYAADNGGSFTSIYRTVKDHSAEWNGDKKGDKSVS